MKITKPQLGLLKEIKCTELHDQKFGAEFIGLKEKDLDGKKELVFERLFEKGLVISERGAISLSEEAERIVTLENVGPMVLMTGSLSDWADFDARG